jgi:hypothetical protein
MYHKLPELLTKESESCQWLTPSSLAYTFNGWTGNELGLHWMVKGFDPQTKEKVGRRTRVLL